MPAQRVGRLILVRTAPVGDDAAGGGVVIYARVSSHDQRADLDRQVSRLTAWATGQDLRVRQVVVEVGSERQTPEAAPDFVGPGCEGHCCGASRPVGPFRGGASGGGVVCAGPPDRGGRSPGERTDDLVRDMMEVLTSMCARLYGRRGARNRAVRALTATKHGPGEAP